MVFYRKYRPQSLSELDLKKVRERLTLLISQKESPHAFLLSGPKGLGKTSAARILAREIHGKKLEKGTVDRIVQGSHPDVLEIDAASNRGIDEIRDLRSKVQYSPAELPKKIYIIDEVHMLTREAFNALLKTLEEPPLHVVFILATTEPWKLPETIVSRTFHVEFSEPEISEIVDSLRRIVKGEKLNVEKGVLEAVAELSGGAFRDAAKIFEELVIASDNKVVRMEQVENLYHVAESRQNVKQLYSAFVEFDLNECFEVIEKIEKSGIDFSVVLKDMLSMVRADLLSGKNEYHKLAEILILAYEKLSVSPISALPLEIAATEWCDNESLNDESRIRDNEKSKEQEEVKKKQRYTRKSEAKKDLKNEQELMQKLIAAIDRENKMLAGVLRGLKVETLNDSKLDLIARSRFHHEKVSDKKSIQFLRKTLKNLTGKEMNVTVTIVEKER